HGLRRLLRLLGRSLCREPLFRRGHRHCRAQGQRPAPPGVELGAVPGLGKRPLHRSVAALFLGEPVLARSLPSPVIARSDSDEAIQTASAETVWIASLRRSEEHTSELQSLAYLV